MIPILQAWLVSFAFDAGRYLVVCVPLYVVFHVALRGRMRGRRLQPTRSRTASVRRDVRYSAVTAVVFSMVGVGEWLGARAGVFRVYHRVAERGVAYAVASVVFLIVLQDAYFYFTHRAMHHPRIYARVHRVHHLSTSPSPLSAYAFSPIEALVHALFVPLVTLVLPVHDVAIFAFLGFMIVRNAIGHLGIELLPSGFSRNRVFGWSTTTTHHDMHHQRFASNYGLYFTLWDRIFRTTAHDYDAAFEAASTQRAPSESTSQKPYAICSSGAITGMKPSAAGVPATRKPSSAAACGVKA